MDVARRIYEIRCRIMHTKVGYDEQEPQNPMDATPMSILRRLVSGYTAEAISESEPDSTTLRPP